MIAYLKCKCKSKDRLLVNKLRSEGVEVRITKNNPTYKKEAQAYGARMPFTVDNGKVTEL